MTFTLFKTALGTIGALTFSALAGCSAKAPMHASAAPDLNSAISIPVMANTEKDKDEKAASPLVATVSTDKATYKNGETVTFTVAVRNTGKLPITLTFNSGQIFDIAVRPHSDPDGKALWNYAHGRMFTMAIREVGLAAGEAKSWTAKWKQNDNDGHQLPRESYSVSARVMANGGISAAPIKIALAE